jgi:hypothetical protein
MKLIITEYSCYHNEITYFIKKLLTYEDCWEVIETDYPYEEIIKAGVTFEEAKDFILSLGDKK